MQTNQSWATGPDAWKQFTKQHPELGYRDGRQQFHNFLRYHRDALVRADALRRAKGKFWVAHQSRFCEVAFALATGKDPELPESAPSDVIRRAPTLTGFHPLMRGQTGVVSAPVLP